MSVIVKLEDYYRHEGELKPYLERVLHNIKVVILKDEAESVCRSLNIYYTRTSTYRITSQIPIPPPPRPTYFGAEYDISPSRLYYLTVEPLYRRLGGFIQLDQLFDNPIAVIDTGVNDKHDLFTSNYVMVEKYSTFDGDDGSDQVGHGSHVSGIIATIAPYSHIVSIKVFKGASTTTDKILAGLDLAIQKNAAVVNMSLGGYPDRKEIELWESVLSSMKERGIVNIVAAGNEALIGAVAYPAASKNVIAVGSVNLEYTKSVFSNVDPFNMKPEVTAFGENILSASHTSNKELVRMSGTSMATPIVSGIAYIMRFAYEYAKENNLPPLYLEGAIIDPGKTPFDMTFEALRTLSLKNNPIGYWNLDMGYGVASFRKFTIWDFSLSLHATKPFPQIPPANIPVISEKCPRCIERIVARLVAGKDVAAINWLVTSYPGVLKILVSLRRIDLLEDMLMLSPITVYPILEKEYPEILNMYPYMSEAFETMMERFITGMRTLTWDDAVRLARISVNVNLPRYAYYYRLSFNDKLVIVANKGATTMTTFRIANLKTSTLKLTVYGAEIPPVTSEGMWIARNLWYGSSMAGDVQVLKLGEYSFSDVYENVVFSDLPYIVFVLEQPGAGEIDFYIYTRTTTLGEVETF